ncbi:histidine kinase [Microbacterium sp.]|uniref:histidine kinase n=1 Tax=Microbacterium sp. TaxID=51671 RepID=UPI0025D3EBD3|nr:histidine kinase [Microbacterium sp.]
MSTSPAERLAAVLVGLEGLALAILAGWQVLALAGGDTVSVSSAVALLVLTLVGAAAVIAFAIGIARGQSWGRSGGVVTQLLVLAVAGGALTGADAQPVTAIVLAVPALVTLAMLVAAARRGGTRRGSE